jgi:hypothetical protein
MDQEKNTALLKKNFSNIEKKFDDFFKNGVPRWPGEERDYLRNHHRNLDNLSMQSVTFDRLGLSDLPEPIMKELELAFEAFRKGLAYQ